MDHSHHTEAMDMCHMHMLFNWDTEHLCIIFPQWHIRTTLGLILSLLAIVAMTAGYEFVRDASRKYEQGVAREVGDAPRNLASRRLEQAKTVKALLYAVQVFYSFFIMLLFMTYNAYVMLAVAVGAFVGYMVWGDSSSTKSVACH